MAEWDSIVYYDSDEMVAALNTFHPLRPPSLSSARDFRARFNARVARAYSAASQRRVILTDLACITSKDTVKKLVNY